ncbi:MAG TPA: methyltransferase domain-containing protein [Caldimonas sp.]|nr:methyltransferase domain-containing protein [Caldimonas sp.]
MDERLQRRVQRYGWDLAAADYERLWQAQLGAAQAALLARVAPRPGERVVDVACGTGLVALAAAAAVGAAGSVVGVDLSDAMVEAAQRRAGERGIAHASFVRMDAEALVLADASVDVALCALGLMYLPDPAEAVRELHRVVRPGGRVGLLVWGERSRCGWASVFPIVDAEVTSEVCPLFFRLGPADALARLCRDAGFAAVEQERIEATLVYDDAEAACDAALVGGPVALAWSRFDVATRARVRARYLDTLASWRTPRGGYRVPGEFVVVVAARADHAA